MAYGRINVGGGKDLTAELNQQAQIIEELETKIQEIGAVDITSEVQENTDLIAQVMAELQGKAAPTDPDLKPENIRAGVDILGVVGTMSEGLTSEMFGCTKMAVDEVTFTSRTLTNVNVQHSLNEVPKYVFMVAEDAVKTSSSDVDLAIMACDATYRTMYRYDYTSLYSFSASATPLTTTTIKFLDGSYGATMYFPVGKYTLITMA